MLRLVLAIILAMCCAANSSTLTQRATVWAQADAAMQLPAMQIEEQGIEAFFSDLSFTYDIPIALEIAQNNDELAIYIDDFTGGTLSEFLTRFVAQHEEYTWEIKDGVVTVFPKEKYRDPSFKELLGTRLKTFSIAEKTSCSALEDALVSTPEIKK